VCITSLLCMVPLLNKNRQVVSSFNCMKIIQNGILQIIRHQSFSASFIKNVISPLTMCYTGTSNDQLHNENISSEFCF